LHSLKMCNVKKHWGEKYTLKSTTTNVSNLHCPCEVGAYEYNPVDQICENYEEKLTRYEEDNGHRLRGNKLQWTPKEEGEP